MSLNQYWHISKLINKIRPANILIFGLGFDSIVWNKINRNGKTCFVEDNTEWIEKFKNRKLNIKKVTYKTCIEDYEKYGFYDEQLFLELDKDTLNTKWELIIVDAPLGHQPPRKWSGPGRMSSLYTAKKLSKYARYIVVDDFSRKIENLYSKEYFGKKNLYKIIDNKLAFFKI